MPNVKQHGFFLILFPVFFLATLSACSVYEEESYFEPVKTDTYLLDGYQGKTDFVLGGDYALSPSDINFIDDLSSFDGNSKEDISAVFVGNINEIANRRIILYLHDRFGNIDTYWQRIKLLANLGTNDYGILAIDYRGYGKSTGTTTELSMTFDTGAAIDWLQAQGVDGTNLILYGYGLGSVPAIDVMVTPRSLIPAKVILEAPIASMELLLQDALYQSIPVEYLTHLSFDNIGKISSVTQPLHWIHGTEDNIYPLSHGQRLYDKHSGFKTKNIVENANHFNLPQSINLEPNNFQQYLLLLRIFIES